MTVREAYYDLCGYTLTRGDPAFIHQQVVDAFAAQTADEHSKPITITFALVGLYLQVERRLTGRQVQRAHQYLARVKRPWPSFALPKERGSITATDVIGQPAGIARDDAIYAWCGSVWGAFRDAQPLVAELWRVYGEPTPLQTKTYQTTQ